MNTARESGAPSFEGPGALPVPAAAEPAGGAVPTTSLRTLPADQFGLAQARHLLWRAGFGGTPGQIRTLVNWGLDKSVDYLINPEKVKDQEVPADLFKADIVRPPSDEERQIQRRAQRERDEDTLAELRLRVQQREREDREQMRRLQQWWLTRMIETSRPLQEKMVLFWHGHFATSYRTIEDSYHMFKQNRLFREKGLESFAELLGSIVRDPAMLAYLDNNDSRKTRPNENLAREIMELFALGVGNYTEQDIKEGARALTGYTFRDDEFVFDRGNHDNNPKTIFGRRDNFDGDEFVQMILAHPACSKFIAAKLYRFFAHDHPTGFKPFDDAAQVVISDMATRLRATKYDIGKTLRVLLTSEHFFSPAIMGEQIKSPVQLTVGAIRSLRVPPRDIAALNDASDRMGQSIFYPPSVKGWDGGRSWINTSTMFVRQNTLIFLLTGRRPQGRDGLADREPFDGQALLADLADTYPEARRTDGGGAEDGMLTALCRFALGTARPGGLAVFQKFVAERGGRVTKDNLTDLLMLMTAAPEYQLC
jgi:uncharacterized protein (DUF1800 family)